MLTDKKGERFSKSKGKGVDPIDMINKFGCDALRMALIVGVGPGNDSRFDEQKVKGYKNFANKIWNASRFVLEHTSDIFEVSKGTFDISAWPKRPKIIGEFGSLVSDITNDMENYNFYLAAEKIYHYFWHSFADIIIEDCKNRIRENNETESAKNLLYYLLKSN